jgi:hypothetical protein
LVSADAGVTHGFDWLKPFSVNNIAKAKPKLKFNKAEV